MRLYVGGGRGGEKVAFQLVLLGELKCKRLF